MKPRLVLTGVMAMAGIAFAACGGEGQATPAISPADFQIRIDNPLFPLSSLRPKVFEGEERNPETGEAIKTRLESTAMPQTTVVAGVEVMVLQEKNYENGELVESTLDYFAQRKDSSVYYFGELVDGYDGGKIVGHKGQGLAGEGRNQPGVFTPARPTAGATFEQEQAPGVAEDRSKVVATDVTVTTPAGTFTGCIKTEDFSSIDHTTEYKYTAPASARCARSPLKASASSSATRGKM